MSTHGFLPVYSSGSMKLVTKCRKIFFFSNVLDQPINQSLSISMRTVVHSQPLAAHRRSKNEESAVQHASQRSEEVAVVVPTWRSRSASQVIVNIDPLSSLFYGRYMPDIDAFLPPSMVDTGWGLRKWAPKSTSQYLLSFMDTDTGRCFASNLPRRRLSSLFYGRCSLDRRQPFFHLPWSIEAPIFTPFFHLLWSTQAGRFASELQGRYLQYLLFTIDASLCEGCRLFTGKTRQKEALGEAKM